MPVPPPASDSSTGSWPDQATDFIVQGVGLVRDKTVGPATTVAKGFVYGTFAIIVGLAAAVLSSILLVRIITVYIPGQRVWIPEIGLGLILCIVAIVLWRKAGKAPKI